MGLLKQNCGNGKEAGGVAQAWVDEGGRADMVDYGLGTGADTAWQGQEAGAV